jgi:hypothetical protein
MVLAVISIGFAPITVLAPALGKFPKWNSPDLESNKNIMALGRFLTLNTSQSWRSIYYLNSGTTLAIILLQFFCYHPPAFDDLHKRKSRISLIQSLDYIGLILFAGSSASLLIGISWGGQSYRE